MKLYLFISIAISGILLIINYWVGESLNLHPFFELLVLFFLGQSIPIGWLTNIAISNPSQSAMVFVGAIGFRMITGLGLLLIIYYFGLPDIIGFSIQFLWVYLFFMVFELIVVLTNLRRNSS